MDLCVLYCFITVVGHLVDKIPFIFFNKNSRRGWTYRMCVQPHGWPPLSKISRMEEFDPSVSHRWTVMPNSHRQHEQAKIRRSYLVRVGIVNRIGNKSRLLATENFETDLRSLKIRWGLLKTVFTCRLLLAPRKSFDILALYKSDYYYYYYYYNTIDKTVWSVSVSVWWTRH